MGVGVERDRDCGVTEPFRDDLGVNAGAGSEQLFGRTAVGGSAPYPGGVIKVWYGGV